MPRTTWEADSLVKRKSEQAAEYKQSFLRQAVCEFRFPTLMELGGKHPPAVFVAALRRDYPHLEIGDEVALDLAGESGCNNTHIFRSTELSWTVSLKLNSFSIETTKYTNHDEMRARVLRVVEAAAKIIDADFFTRVGLRYVNVIDSGAEDPVEGWVNSELTGPLLSARFQGIQDYASRLQLAAPDGGCLIQHGLRLAEGIQVPPTYIVDVDAFRTGVAIADTSDVFEAMHQQASEVFDWALGESARKYLSVNQGS